MAASVVIKKLFRNNIWDKLLKNGPSKICGRQPLKNFTWSILEYFVPYILLITPDQRLHMFISCVKRLIVGGNNRSYALK